MSDDDDPYVTEEIPTVTPLDGLYREDEAPTEPIPRMRNAPTSQSTPTAAPEQQPDGPVDTTAEMPPVPGSKPPRIYPYGQTLRRLILRFFTTIAVLLVVSLWSQWIANPFLSPSGLRDLHIPNVEQLGIWAVLYTLITVIADGVGWWTLPPGWRKLPTRKLAGWLVVSALILRPIHTRLGGVAPLSDITGWMIGAYLLGIVITVLVLRYLPYQRVAPPGSDRTAAVLYGTTFAMLAVLPITGFAYPAASLVRPVYEWAFSWLDPGLGGGGNGNWFVVFGLIVALTVMVFVRHWGNLPGWWAHTPLAVVIVTFLILIGAYPEATVSGFVTGALLWLMLIATRGSFQGR